MIDEIRRLVKKYPGGIEEWETQQERPFVNQGEEGTRESHGITI